MENYWFLAAAATSAFVTGVHFFAGGKYVVRPLLGAEDIDAVSKYTNYYSWHLVTIFLTAMTFSFFVASIRIDAYALAVVMTWVAGVNAAWSITLILWKKQKWMRMSQWSLFIPVALFGSMGMAYPIHLPY